MDKRSSDISVVMSVHNGERYLREAVDSILNQTFSEFEFIIIDDASSDKTADILMDYAKREPRIHLLFNSQNLGLARSLNQGLQQTTGRYIARMDADDVSLPFRLEKQFAFMEKYPDIGVLGTTVELIDSDGRFASKRIYPFDPIIIRWRLAFENPLCHSTAMIRQEILQGIQYNPDLTTAQDYSLWCQLGSKVRFANIPEPLLLFRKHGASLTYKKGEQQRRNSLCISHKYLKNLLKMPVEKEAVDYLWRRQNLSLKQTLVIVKLMEKFAQVIIAEPGWNTFERKVLRHHAARWIYERARNRFSNPLAWQIVYKAINLDPLGMLQSLLHLFIPARSL